MLPRFLRLVQWAAAWHPLAYLVLALCHAGEPVALLCYLWLALAVAHRR